VSLYFGKILATCCYTVSLVLELPEHCKNVIDRSVVTMINLGSLTQATH